MTGLLTAAVCLTLSGCGMQYIFRQEPTIALNYGYKSLDSEALQQAYDILHENIRSAYSESFDVPSVTPEGFVRVIEAYEDDHPEVFWLDTASRYRYIDYGDSCEIHLSYSLEGDELEQAKKELEDGVSAAIAAAPEKATDYEIECFLNDYMIAQCDYNREATDQHNAYGSLVRKQAVCDPRAFSFCATVWGSPV